MEAGTASPWGGGTSSGHDPMRPCHLLTRLAIHRHRYTTVRIPPRGDFDGGSCDRTGSIRAELVSRPSVGLTARVRVARFEPTPHSSAWPKKRVRCHLLYSTWRDSRPRACHFLRARFRPQNHLASAFSTHRSLASSPVEMRSRLRNDSLAFLTRRRCRLR
ncbi:hypothetical protein BHM03_00032877 [Ensete ventricosum]|nr:hypothetical protein BHM03_00032877 [Ensete ventricosum]